MNEYYIVTFQNTHEAMNGEKVAKENKIKIMVIPTPTYITKSCGISLRVKEENIEDLKQLVKQDKMKVKNIHFKKGQEVSIIF
ncbi:DUF3343 domain-containing protein [Haloimpatiens sp. FM7330]|uniref:DUF3343 domain-containing protein n=1 Tax=Haloimpatiens sp. FM7330 TaxID=3298610 RepID=UPI003625AA83